MKKPLSQHLLGAGTGRTIPARVLQAIAAQQATSEILIGWIQLSIGCVLGLLYAVSPKTFMDDVPFEPVPVALSVYVGFTVLRLVLAYRVTLPVWFLALSVVMDMLLLYSLIWSFHLQYGQPAAFYLKAPTLLYVFIFIALRALRFDARFVMLAGLSAAAGWGLLVWLAVHSMASPSMITRDYVEYMTSNTILIGAEIDKIVSILFVTGVLSLAIVRARRLLERATLDQTAAEDLSRFFAPEIAMRITASDDRIMPGEGDLRDAAILTCDIRGFTRFARSRPPTEVMTVLANYEARLVPIIQRHGGSIDKFLGDGILATFGAAVRTDTYAADALRCMTDLAAEAGRWADKRAANGRDPLAINFGVATGTVVFGAVGHDNRLEYTVIGDAVNLAAKLEAHNKATHTIALTDTGTLTLAQRQGYDPFGVKLLPGQAVAGVSAPVDVAVIVA